MTLVHDVHTVHFVYVAVSRSKRMSTIRKWCGCPLVALLVTASATAGDTFELKGKITNPFTEEQYRAVTVLVTDRLATELGRTHPDKSGHYELKITGPQFIIIKAELEGFPTVKYQLDTKQYKESTTDREENRVFGELRIQTYYQNITFGEQENDRALDVFKRAQALRPEHSWGYIGLGMALNNKQDYRGAVQHLEKAVALEPSSVSARYQLAFSLFSLGENDRASDCFTQVLDTNPSFNPMIYKYLSSIRIKKGDADGAARALESYLTQFPDAQDRDKVEQILKKLGH